MEKIKNKTSKEANLQAPAQVKTQITIDDSNSHQRLDRFLRKFFKSDKAIVLGDIYAGIRKGEITINNRKTTQEYRLNEGDLLTIQKLENKKPRVHKTEKLDMDAFKQRILYEDENWLAVDKPYDMVMHTNDPREIAIQDYIDVYCKKLKTATFTPSFGYRLDRDTTGVLIAAKTFAALQYINKIIRNREISKHYVAIVAGKFPEHIIINKALEKQFNEKLKRGQTVVNERYGEKAISECWNEKTVAHPVLGDISRIKVKIETGRMHQIRVHVASIGFPVLGDIVYGKAVLNRVLARRLDVKRQLLHAQEYKFFDIFSQKSLTISAPMPQDFKTVMAAKQN